MASRVPSRPLHGVLYKGISADTQGPYRRTWLPKGTLGQVGLTVKAGALWPL
jgi:hypothetical protein